MKKNLFIAGVCAFLLSPVMVSCDKEDDIALTPEISQAVTRLYPSAHIIEVERTVSGYDVEMIYNNSKVEVLLDKNYNWINSCFEDVAWSSVPEAVSTSLANDGYTFVEYKDDVDRIEYPVGDSKGEYYRIEIDREPRDIILLYNPDGSKR